MKPVTVARRRLAARVIVMDEHDRILLLRYDEGAGEFWATPGGALKPGETHTQAALRELREELGVQAVRLGPRLARRAQVHTIDGEPVEQVEEYFTARVRAADVDEGKATQTDDILAWQWWTLDDLDGTGRTVYPFGLAALVRRYLAEGAPAEPLILSG